jgi:hypothetical protein
MLLRETGARLRKRVKFLGVEGGVLPLVVAGTISAGLVLPATQPVNPGLLCVAVAPFFLTFGYMLVFVTNRRPHFARDFLFLCFGGAKSVSPKIPNQQPRHPGMPRVTRGINGATANH